MMKKKLLLLLIPLLTLGLSSCVLYNGQGKPGGKSATPTPSSSVSPDTSSVTPPNPAPHETPDDTPTGEKITVYLVFGQYGKYEGELVTTKEDSLFLEHVKKMENMTVGSDLPGKDKVTSAVEGRIFLNWVMYKNDGKLTEYTKVPAIKDAILYASFGEDPDNPSQGGGGSGGESGGGSSTPSEFKPASADELKTEGYGLKFLGMYPSYMAAVQVEDFEDFSQYRISMRSFKKGQEFQLYDFEHSAGWAAKVNPYSFGGSESSLEWGKYISKDGDEKYTVLQDFNVSDIYIKMKFGVDEIYFALG